MIKLFSFSPSLFYLFVLFFFFLHVAAMLHTGSAFRAERRHIRHCIYSLVTIFAVLIVFFLDMEFARLLYELRTMFWQSFYVKTFLVPLYSSTQINDIIVRALIEWYIMIAQCCITMYIFIYASTILTYLLCVFFLVDGYEIVIDVLSCSNKIVLISDFEHYSALFFLFLVVLLIFRILIFRRNISLVRFIPEDMEEALPSVHFYIIFLLCYISWLCFFIVLMLMLIYLWRSVSFVDIEHASASYAFALDELDAGSSFFEAIEILFNVEAFEVDPSSSSSNANTYDEVDPSSSSSNANTYDADAGSTGLYKGSNSFFISVSDMEKEWYYWDTGYNIYSNTTLSEIEIELGRRRYYYIYVDHTEDPTKLYNIESELERIRLYRRFSNNAFK